MITDRLLIRLIERSDFEDICEYGCDEETGQFMIHWPKTKEQVAIFIEDCMTAIHSEKPTWYEYVIQLIENNKVIGNVSLIVENREAEIGWISNKRYWNHGYMSEAVSSIIQHAFQNLGIETIFATCTDLNKASFKVMEKCKMTKISTEYNHKAVRQGIEVTYNKLTYCIQKVQECD
jgi:ribosomal-protein-alanine N-acetyltransferase